MGLKPRSSLLQNYIGLPAYTLCLLRVYSVDYLSIVEIVYAILFICIQSLNVENNDIYYEVVGLLEIQTGTMQLPDIAVNTERPIGVWGFVFVTH